MTDKVLFGTVRCWRLRDVGDSAPYTAVCRCGWWEPGQRSHRAAKAAWHAHIRLVRDGLKAAAGAAS